MWLLQAEQLAASAAEIGEDAALISAAAWRARVDTRATQSLTDAAKTLWATPESLLRGGGRPLPHDKEMLSRTCDLETDTGTLLKRARDLFDLVAGALEAACLAARAAAAASAAAKTSEETSAAASAMAEAQRQIGDCEAALEIIQDTGERLAHALACLQRVPDDLAETYEAPYDHIRRGGVLPHSGEFLTGSTARGAA